MKRKSKLIVFSTLSCLAAAAVVAVSLSGFKGVKASKGDGFGVTFDGSSYVADSFHYDEETWFYVADYQAYTYEQAGQQYLVVGDSYAWDEAESLTEANYSAGSSMFNYNKSDSYVMIYFYLYLQIAEQTTVTDEDISVAGDYDEYAISINVTRRDADEDFTKDYYEVSIYIDNTVDHNHEVMRAISVTSISVTYDC